MPELKPIKRGLKEFGRKLASFFGNQSKELLTFEEAQRRLKIWSKGQRRFVEGIDVDKIVGGIEGRKWEFDRHFMPRHKTSKTKQIEKADLVSFSIPNFPPIELRKVGDVYFVVDGHHRVSWAKRKGVKYIDAYVTEYESRVPLTGDYLDFRLNERRLNFLERTNIDKLRPEQNIKPTLPEGYREIEEHIAIHMYNMAQDRGEPVTIPEAVKSWYDHIYKPIVELIRKHNVVKQMDGKTETDVYIWSMNNWLRLWEEWREREPTDVVKDLAND